MLFINAGSATWRDAREDDSEARKPSLVLVLYIFDSIILHKLIITNMNLPYKKEYMKTLVVIWLRVWWPSYVQYITTINTHTFEQKRTNWHDTGRGLFLDRHYRTV